MAVTIINQPAQNYINSVSNGFEIEVTSDKIAEDNFKYTFRIVVDGVQIGVKKVPSTGTNTIVDLSETIKAYILSYFVFGINDIEVYDDNSSVVEVSVYAGDQYSLNGSTVASELVAESYTVQRGLGEVVNSRYELGSSDPYFRIIKGVPYISNHIVDELDYLGSITVTVKSYDKDNMLLSIDTMTLTQASLTKKELIYYFPVGTTNSPFVFDINTVRREITTTAGDNQYSMTARIYDNCYQNPVTLMFLDKYFQWSFFTFDAINASSLIREKSTWESEAEGKHNFDVKGREKMVLTSTYIAEDEAVDIPDLFLSDEVYLIPSNNFSTEYQMVIIDQSSLDVKTNQKDGVINYTFKIEKSARIFRP